MESPINRAREVMERAIPLLDELAQIRAERDRLAEQVRALTAELDRAIRRQQVIRETLIEYGIPGHWTMNGQWLGDMIYGPHHTAVRALAEFARLGGCGVTPEQAAPTETSDER